MNKTELIEALAKSHFAGNKTTASRMLTAVVEGITDGLASSGKVTISGFGVFETVHRDARTVRNPRTGASKAVDAYNFPRFRPGTGLRNAVDVDGAPAAVAVHAKKPRLA